MLVSILSRRRPAMILAATGVGAIAVLLARTGIAHAADVEGESVFILNTFAFLVWGVLIMWMCAGFTMLESGSVRTKNAAMICLKNIGLYSIAGLAYFFIGYNFMYGDTVAGIIGTPAFMYLPSSAEVALLEAGEAEAAAATAKVLGEGNYSVMSDWFFQMVFVATAASIVSGALAERVKMWSFFAFTLLLTAIIYPVVGAWTWAEAAGSATWVSVTLPAPPSYTAPVAGRPSPVCWSSGPGWASSGATAPSEPRHPPTYSR